MPEEQRSIILDNAVIRIPPRGRPQTRSLALRDGIVVSVGGREEARSAASDAEALDLEGRLVLPGFIDSHVHMLSGGESLTGLDLGGAADAAEFARLIRERVLTTPPGQWITGGRWNAERWPRGRLPDRGIIDTFSRETPVFVKRTDGHIGLANIRALEISGLTAATADPPGGVLDRDCEGRLTGIIRDAAMALVEKHIPEPAPADREAMLRRALAHAVSLGVTAVVDQASPSALPVYGKLAKAGELPCRVFYNFRFRNWPEAREASRVWNDRGGFLRVPGIKAFVDGSLGARTALMFEPYADEPGNAGLSLEEVSSGELEEALAKARAAGLDLSVHAIGDRAVATLLDMFNRIRQAAPGAPGLMRIEHAQHLRREDIPRLAAEDLVASVQPAHIPLDAAAVDAALGPDRAALTYPFRSLIDAGARLAFGTDWPVVPLDPLACIRASVTREAPGLDCPDGWVPQERLSIAEAIECYTAGSAFGVGAQAFLGSIAPGRAADLAVLSQDIFEAEPARIKDALVELTICGGRVVHKGPAFA